MNMQPDNSNRWIESFYKDLQDLVDSTFPKKCSKCGKVYDSKDAFLTETMPVKDLTLEDRSGLFSLEGGPVETAVGLFRNCRCGSTLMADFQDRRNSSDNGQSRRQRFAALLDVLSAKGTPRADARRELLSILNGGKSELIETLVGNADIT